VQAIDLALSCRFIRLNAVKRARFKEAPRPIFAGVRVEQDEELRARQLLPDFLTEIFRFVDLFGKKNIDAGQNRAEGLLDLLANNPSLAL
jgi:hypothetical protein